MSIEIWVSVPGWKASAHSVIFVSILPSLQIPHSDIKALELLLGYDVGV